jgi:PAS domain S-box-containing protein
MRATSDVGQVEHAFLRDCGEMGRRIAEYDWSSTAIGGIDGWPSVLRHTVSMMLASPVPIVLLWGEAGVMIYNDAYSVFAGGRDSRLLGSNVREGWEEVAAFNDNVMRVGLSGGTLSYRSHELVLSRNGQPENVWLDLDYSPIRDDEGKPAGVIAVVVEITDAVRMRAALEKSEAQFGALAQNMPNQVWTARADGWLDWFNDQVYAYSGEERGSLDGNGWARTVHPDDLPTSVKRWRTSLASGSIYENELRLCDAAGVYHWHLTRAVPLRNALGTITAWVGTNTEIDAQKRVEETYAQDRDRLWTTSQDILLVCDYQGRITAINPSAERLLGWTADEMIGRLITDFVHPDDLEDTGREVAKIATGVPTLVYENRYRTRSGEYRLLDWTAVPDGVRIHGVGRDITDQRAIEDAHARARRWRRSAS